MLEITRLGQATFQFRLDSGAMDPWAEGNLKYPKSHEFERIATILISHAHFDLAVTMTHAIHSCGIQDEKPRATCFICERKDRLFRR